MSDGLPRQAPLQPGAVAPPSAPAPSRRPSRTSRHAGLATYRRDVDGVEVELFEPRLPPTPAAAGADAARPGAGLSPRDTLSPRDALRARYTVRPGDRLDLVAARLLGDPHAYWRLADANPGDLAALEEPGRELDLPGGG